MIRFTKTITARNYSYHQALCHVFVSFASSFRRSILDGDFSVYYVFLTTQAGRTAFGWRQGKVTDIGKALGFYYHADITPSLIEFHQLLSHHFGDILEVIHLQAH